MNRVLVTGGAGYIGSHVALQLHESGHHVVVLDTLHRGFREAVIGATLVVGNAGDQQTVSDVLRKHDIDTVMHFAALTVVPESVTDPLRYYDNNTCNTASLLRSCVQAGVANFVFSSTAAVYGSPEQQLVDENCPTVPINPYGTSKLMSELMLRDVAATGALRYVALRYFNVAGANLEGLIGQSTRDATLLVKVACEAALGKRDSISIFGTDYPTADGTGIRDYIHVVDLANAHIRALEYLHAGGESQTLNCGYGHGYSVREVLDSVQRQTGVTLAINEAPRRAGDPAALVAVSARAKQVLGWAPEHDDLDVIVATALVWEREPKY
jgi:UDP-glucose 4-epimerase